jgi:hypothetical protein
MDSTAIWILLPLAILLALDLASVRWGAHSRNSSRPERDW